MLNFAWKQKAFRSMLVCTDYYTSIRRIKVDQFMVDMPEDNDRKLAVDFDLKKSSDVVVDYGRIVPEARQSLIAFDSNGRLSGIFKTCFSNGNILAEVSYQQGLLNGRCVVYYPNGFFA